MTQDGKTLRRILIMLTLLGADLEWFTMDMAPEKKKKWINIYKQKIDWVKRDIVTSAPNSQTFADVFNELNGDHVANLTEWLDLGISCDNLEEVIAMLKECTVTLKRA